MHALRLKGFADTPVIAEAAEIDEATAKQVLDGFAEQELAKYREGRMTGWMPTREGRAHGEVLLAAELDASDKRDALDAIYRRFLEHNQAFLALCTDWQTRIVDGEQIINDHNDAEYDATIFERLAETDQAMQPICTDLGTLLDRCASYAPRFGEALAKVQGGEIEWITKPVIDSYHTVWHELHEDLLASLGIDRSNEGHA